MGLSDWTDLELLSRKIADSQERLEQALVTQNHGLVTLLQKEIAAAEILRDRTLSDIAAYLTSSAVSAEQETAISPAVNANAAPREPTAVEKPAEGVQNVWNQLSHNDLQRIRRELDLRRSEMLARHAEELKTLDADQAEIDILEQAISEFARKFNIGGAEILPLERPAFSQAG